MTLQQWLDSPLYKGKERPLVGERLAELFAVNGYRFHVGGWGFTGGDGLYGRTGLEQEEALELIHLQGVLTGFTLAGLNHGEAERYFEKEYTKQGCNHDK